jgi:hypothetical protein
MDAPSTVLVKFADCRIRTMERHAMHAASLLCGLIDVHRPGQLSPVSDCESHGSRRPSSAASHTHEMGSDPMISCLDSGPPVHSCGVYE